MLVLVIEKALVLNVTASFRNRETGKLKPLNPKPYTLQVLTVAILRRRPLQARVTKGSELRFMVPQGATRTIRKP